jgi:hypothetical protein
MVKIIKTSASNGTIHREVHIGDVASFIMQITNSHQKSIEISTSDGLLKLRGDALFATTTS